MADARARAGTGFADIPDSRAAAEAAARAARARAGDGTPSLAFCFHHGRHDPHEVRAGVEGVLGSAVPLVGETAMGVMTNDDLGYEGHQVGVAVITEAHDGVRVSSEDGLGARGEQAVGRSLGAALAAPERDVLLLYSSVRSGLMDPGGMSLFFGTPLLQGFRESFPDPRTLAGAGLIDAFQPSTSHVFTPEAILKDGVVAVSVGGHLRMSSAVLHGCLPAGSYHEITETDGPLVLGIDGRPALDVIDELMGGRGDYDSYPFQVILGVNHGERFGPFDAESYQTRLCLAVVPERRGLVMFEPDLEAGASVQLMRVSRDLDYVRERVAVALERLAGRRPLLALYADCAGRCMAASPLEAEDGDAVREAVGDIPVLGFYTGVEIGQVGSEVRPLDWTGVLCILSA